MAAVPCAWFYDNNGARCGPVSAAVLQDLLHSGEVSPDTLAWNETFGLSWKPIRETDIALGDKTPPPLPVGWINSTYAWLIALSPVIGALASVLWGNAISPPSSLAYSLVFSLVVVALAFMDARAIVRSGRTSKQAASPFLFALFPPLYFIKRSRLLGRSLLYLWIWLVAIVVSVLILNSGILSGIYFGTGVPSCSSSFTTGLLRGAFARISNMQLAGISALNVSDDMEISSTATSRNCRATVTASDVRNYHVSYTVEIRGTQIFVTATLAP